MKAASFWRSGVGARRMARMSACSSRVKTHWDGTERSDARGDMRYLDARADVKEKKVGSRPCTACLYDRAYSKSSKGKPATGYSVGV
jgi:hypothetical protein